MHKFFLIFKLPTNEGMGSWDDTWQDECVHALNYKHAVDVLLTKYPDAYNIENVSDQEIEYVQAKKQSTYQAICQQPHQSHLGIYGS